MEWIPGALPSAARNVRGDLSPASSTEGHLGMSGNITRFSHAITCTSNPLLDFAVPTKEFVEEPLSYFEVRCSKFLHKDRYLLLDDDVLTSVRCPAVLFLSCMG